MLIFFLVLCGLLPPESELTITAIQGQKYIFFLYKKQKPIKINLSVPKIYFIFGLKYLFRPEYFFCVLSTFFFISAYFTICDCLSKKVSCFSFFASLERNKFKKNSIGVSNHPKTFTAFRLLRFYP